MPKIIAMDKNGFRHDTRFPRKWLLLAVLVVLIVSVGGYWWATHKATPVAVQKTVQNPTTKGVPIKNPAEYNSELSKANKTEDKVTLFRGLITSQQLNGDVAGALKSAQELLIIDKSASTYAVLGGLYKATGQKPQAIDAYKKALELVPVTTDPDLMTDYNLYKQALDKLQGGA